MSTNLTDLIEACREAKKGDKEFILSTNHVDGWLAGIGNGRCMHVALGEVQGEFEVSGRTPEEAVTRLLEVIRSHDGVWPGR